MWTNYSQIGDTLRQQLLQEAHEGVFSGHFSEKKVYDKIFTAIGGMD